VDWALIQKNVKNKKEKKSCRRKLWRKKMGKGR
jgi:hypothetical protein